MARGIQRDRKKERRWRRCVSAQARSGLSVRAWCGRHGVGEPSFHWWRRELARRYAEAPATSVAPGKPAFVPVRVTQASRVMNRSGVADAAEAPLTAPPIEILLEHPRRILLHGPVDRQALSDVLAVLEGDGVSRGGAEALAC